VGTVSDLGRAYQQNPEGENLSWKGAKGKEKSAVKSHKSGCVAGEENVEEGGLKVV